MRKTQKIVQRRLTIGKEEELQREDLIEHEIDKELEMKKDISEKEIPEHKIPSEKTD